MSHFKPFGWIVAVALFAAAANAAAQVHVYTSEAAYLAALPAGGYQQLVEGFEGSAWGGVRTTIAGGVHAAGSVTSNGISWTTSTEITTNDISPRSGNWRGYDHPGGAPDVLEGSSSVTLFGIGGWFTSNTLPANVRIYINGVSPDNATLALGADYQFLGVISATGFTTFRVTGTEGTPGDQKHWFADDFTFAVAGAAANSPPNGVITAPIGNVTVQPGEAVSFAGSTSDPDGDAVSVLWSFGDGATSTQLVPGTHAYTTAGSYTVTLTATDSHGLADPTPDTRLVTVGHSQAVRTTGVVAGVANVRGLRGSDWHTDVFLHNAGQTAATVVLYYSPRGGTVDPGQGRQLTVSPGQTLTLADVVNTLFGITGSGSIQWEVTAGDETTLLVAADTYNRVDDVRKYGQQVPGVRWSTAALPGSSLFAPAVAGRYRTNLGFSTDWDCTRVNVRGYDRTGALKVERGIDVLPLTWYQLDDMFGQAFPGLIANPEAATLAESVHRFEVAGTNGRVVAYTTIIDNTTNDASYFLARPRSAGVNQVWLPSVAHLAGANGSQWRSDVFLLSLSGQVLSPTIAFYPSGRDNSGHAISTATALSPGQAAVSEKVLQDVFLLTPPQVGSLRLASLGGEVLAFMRTYTEEQNALGQVVTYGQAIQASTSGDAVGGSFEGRIYGFSHGPGLRSNLILQNTRADASGALVASNILVEVLSADGALLASRTYALRPGEYLQVNRFAEGYGLGTIAGGSLRISLLDDVVKTFTGGVDAIVTEVNGNVLPGTNDSRLLRVELVQAR